MNHVRLNFAAGAEHDNSNGVAPKRSAHDPTMKETFEAVFQEEPPVFNIDATNIDELDISKCTTDVIRDADGDAVAGGLVEFTRELFSLQLVQGVAFVAAKDPVARKTLSIEVVAPLVDGDPESDDTLEAILDADDRLSERTADVLPSALQFVDSTGLDARIVAESLKRQWKEDGGLRPIAIAIFRRG